MLALITLCALAPTVPQCGNQQLARPSDQFFSMAAHEGSLLALGSDYLTPYRYDGSGWVRGAVPFNYQAELQTALGIGVNPQDERFVFTLADDVLAIGYHDAAGFGAWPFSAALIYRLQGGSWVQEHIDFLGPWGHAMSNLGLPTGGAIHHSGDVFAFGVPNLSYGAGALLLAQRTATGWVDLHANQFNGSTPATGSLRGTSVDFDREWLYSGGPGSGSGSAPRGAVRVSELNNGDVTSGWIRTSILPQATTGSGFGLHVSADQGSVVVASYMGSLEHFERVGTAHQSQGLIALPTAYQGAEVGGLDLYRGHLLVELKDLGVLLEYERVQGAFVLTRTRSNLDAAGGKIGARTPFGVVTRGTSSLIAEVEQHFVQRICGCATTGPCGNANASGGCVNSTGVGSRLSVCGSTRVGADDLVLTAVGLPPSTFAIPLMGRAAAGVALGNGELCLGGTILRFPVQQAIGTTMELGGLVATSQASHPAASALAAGRTWTLQVWYRDAGGPCGAASNLTDALTVTFTP